jgi:hypothetical protein
VLKTLAVVAAEPATVTDVAPFKLSAVAFVNVTVGFRIVAVPPLAPIAIVVDALAPKTRAAPVPEAISTLLILSVLPVVRFQFSDVVQLAFALSQRIVLFVAPKRLRPPPSAVVFVGEATAPTSISLSSTLSVVELMVVVVPLTVRVPVIVTLPAKVGFPV